MKPVIVIFWRCYHASLQQKSLESLLQTSAITPSKNCNNTFVETYAFCTKELFCIPFSEFFVHTITAIKNFCSSCSVLWLLPPPTSICIYEALWTSSILLVINSSNMCILMRDCTFLKKKHYDAVEVKK
jgi:hypothetical protein